MIALLVLLYFCVLASSVTCSSLDNPVKQQVPSIKISRTYIPAVYSSTCPTEYQCATITKLQF